MENNLCNACQWHPKQKDKSYCESCEPLIKQFAKEIIEKYGNKDNKREHLKTPHRIPTSNGW